MSAVEPTEIIAIRRADFFEILRKEHELAVKLLWQFLGVLADRLEQTSRDLSSARQELAAEDITDAIFAEPEDPLARPVEQGLPPPPPVAVVEPHSPSPAAEPAAVDPPPAAPPSAAPGSVQDPSPAEP